MKPNAPKSAPNSEKCLLILCTCPSEAAAATLAREIVTRKLAACVNIVPSVLSVYRWEGEVLEDAEALMLIKTEQSCLQLLKATIQELHTYDVPEVMAVDISNGSRAYLDWLVSSVSRGSPPPVQAET